jgi:hypothetical protein
VAGDVVDGRSGDARRTVRRQRGFLDGSVPLLAEATLIRQVIKWDKCEM